MKILQIHILYTKSKTSGVNEMLFTLIDALRKNGHEAEIFSLDYQPYIDNNYPYIKYFPKNIESWTKGGIINYLKKLGKKIYNKEAQDNLAAILDEIKPDIVHIHSVWELSFSIIKPIKDRNIPIVYTAHDPSYCCPAVFAVGKNFCTQCKGLNTLPCTIKKCIANNIFKSLYYSIKTFIDRINCPVSAFNKIITPSQATADYMSGFNITKDKFVVLDNFLQKKDLEKEPNYCNNGYFLFAGGIYFQKGIFTLIEVMKQLPKDIELHIAGEAPLEKDNKKFRDLLEENNLSNVKFLGRLSKEQLDEEYKNCISVIVPSEWFETFGMITIEAASYGKPSIGAKIGGIQNVIDDNITGQLFESGNKEQLKECILKYWNNPALVVEHGKNAYKKVHEQYTEERYFRELMNVYEEVLNNAK